MMEATTIRGTGDEDDNDDGHDSGDKEEEDEHEYDERLWIRWLHHQIHPIAVAICMARAGATLVLMPHINIEGIVIQI